MAQNLTAAKVSRLKAAFDALPKGPVGYDQSAWIDLGTYVLAVDGETWRAEVSPHDGPVQNLIGFNQDVGGGYLDAYNAEGWFLRRYKADNSWNDLIRAVSLPALAYGAYTFGVAGGAGAAEAAAASGAGDAFLPGAMGVDGGSAYAASQAAAFEASIAPWAAGAASGAVTGTAASTATSAMAPLTRGAGVLASALGATQGGQHTGTVAQPLSTLRQQTPGTPGTIAGFPLELVLIVGAAIVALA